MLPRPAALLEGLIHRTIRYWFTTGTVQPLMAIFLSGRIALFPPRTDHIKALRAFDITRWKLFPDVANTDFCVQIRHTYIPQLRIM